MRRVDKQIDALGRFIDTELKAHDVRLTMGGEPTFVSIDDMDGAEWNFTALGPAKRLFVNTAATGTAARAAMTTKSSVSSLTPMLAT